MYQDYGSAYIGQRRDKMTIINLRLYETMGYQDQFLRPNKTTVTGQILNNIDHMLGQYGSKIPTQAISRSTSKFMLPSARVETFSDRGTPRAMDVRIDNGWGEKRFMFIMQVEIETNGIRNIELVSGYTDRADHVVRGNEVFIADDTIFYVNSVSRIKQMGAPMIQSAYSVTGGGMGAGTFHDQNTYRMTPMNLIQHADIERIEGLSTVANNPDIRIAGSHVVGNQPVITDRLYSSPTTMFRRIMQSFTSSIMQASNSAMMTADDIYTNTRAAVGDPDIFSCRFISNINMNGTSGSVFEYRRLKDLCPHLEEIVDISLLDFTVDGRLGEYWDTSTRETQMALIASTMVSTLMLNMSLTELAFVSTNMMGNNGFMPLDQPFLTEIRRALSLQSDRLTPNHFDAIADVINSELAEVLSENNEIGYDIEVHAMINQDIQIRIRFENNPWTDYTFPSFADSIISPILTTKADTYRQSISDVGSVMDHVVNNRSILDPRNVMHDVNDEYRPSFADRYGESRYPDRYDYQDAAPRYDPEPVRHDTGNRF